MKKAMTVCALVLMLVSAASSADAPKSADSTIIWARRDTGLAFLIGGMVDGKLLSYDEMADRLKGGEIYKLYSPDAYLQQATGTKVNRAEGCYYSLDISSTKKVRKDVLGICAEWDALPRKPKQQSTKQAVYEEAARAVLKDHGLQNVGVNITQVIRIDLEGDGKQEVLVSATCPSRDYMLFPAEGDYSFVLLRRVNGEHVETMLLGGQFFLKDREHGEPPSHRYEVFGILDIDGDGKMEVVLKIRYYEGDYFQFISTGETGFDDLATMLLGF